MTSSRREPLSAEERDLASRLARALPDAAPSATLDARILALAAARTSPGVRVGDRRRRRRRRPVAFGVAAMLIVTLGLAWQLRPRPEPVLINTKSIPAQVSSASSKADTVESENQQAVAASAAQSETESAPDLTPVEQAAAGQRLSRARNTIGPGGAGAEAFTSKRVAQDSDQASDPTVKMRTDRAGHEASADRSTSPAPRSSQNVEKKADESADEIVFDTGDARQAPTASAAASAQTEDVLIERADANRSRGDQRNTDQVRQSQAHADPVRDNESYSEHEMDDLPPATADSPEVQRAWLAQIRELLANGQTETARASLAEFKRRNARYALPEDLRDLAP